MRASRQAGEAAAGKAGAARCGGVVSAALVLLLLLGAPVALRASSGPMATRAPEQTQASGAASTPAASSSETSEQEIDENATYLQSPVVRAMGRRLGLNPEQAAITFQVLNFVVLAGLVGWFLVRTLPRTFRNRTGHIQKQLVDARSATEEANARLNSVESRLGKLDEEIAGLRGQAERDARIEEERMRAAIEDERGKIVAAAEQEIVTATAQARRQIQVFAAELAIDQAAKKLVVTAETDRLLVQEFARRLEDKNPRGGQN